MIWQGELLHIHVAPQASAPMQALGEARLIPEIGIAGDRYATGLGAWSSKPHIDRQVTLIESETLDALARDRAIELQSHEHRRNLTTRGAPLNHLVGRYFHVGGCVLFGGRLNVPCAYLDELLGKKVFKPLLNRSGLNCRIILGGLIRPGDVLRPCDPDTLDASLRARNESVPLAPAPDP